MIAGFVAVNAQTPSLQQGSIVIYQEKAAIVTDMEPLQVIVFELGTAKRVVTEEELTVVTHEHEKGRKWWKK